jgi:transposase-like protein
MEVKFMEYDWFYRPTRDEYCGANQPSKINITEIKMETIKCPNCGSTKLKYIKYNSQWNSSEYFCDDCKKTILNPDSTWD